MLVGWQTGVHSSSVWSFCLSFSIFLSSLRRVLSLFSVPVVSSFFSSPISRTREYSSWFVMPKKQVINILQSDCKNGKLDSILKMNRNASQAKTDATLIYRVRGHTSPELFILFVFNECHSALPILAQMVMSMSLTILESSTMTVFTVPSNIRILSGLCFFLYSSVSYKMKENQNQFKVSQETL